jgi:hypothetical protein
VRQRIAVERQTENVVIHRLKHKMAEDLICKYCGVIVATENEVPFGFLGKILYRYGVQHKPNCPHNHDKKEDELYNDFLK